MDLEKVKQIHNASIEILQKVGIEFQDEEVMQILKDNGIKVESKRAYFTEEQIMENMKKAPSSFTINAKNTKYNMNISTDSVDYTTGYGCSKIREFDGHIRDANLDDYLKFLKLVHSSDIFKINGGIVVQPNDIDAKLSQAIMVYSTIKNSDKCILAVPGTKKAFSEVIDLVSILFGGKENLSEKPRMITLISTLSPMKVDENALACIKLSCKYKQPMVITPGPMAGATGPISLAGNIAMGNAETIATIALSQILKPGTPIVYGLACTTSDMKTGSVSIGSPGFPLQGKYGSALSKMYNLPNRTSGGQSDANGMTSQAGYESMLSLNTAHQTKANFVMHSAGILDSFSCMSFEKFIVDLEIISMLKYFYGDIEISDKTLAIDVIEDVVKNEKLFLNHKHTAKRCRKDPWLPNISQRGKLKLNDTPENIMKNTIDNQIDKLLSNYTKPSIDELTNLALVDYMKSIGVDENTIHRIDSI